VALVDHIRRGGQLDPTLEQAARLVVRYLLGTAHAYAEHLRRRLLGPGHTLARGFIRFPGDARVDGSVLWLPCRSRLPTSGGKLRHLQCRN
jgi:hypothetical protein